MVIKVKRGPLSSLAGSGAIDGEIKFTKDTNDLYVYNDTATAGNRNVTSPPVVYQYTSGLVADTAYTISNIKLFRFYSIYCTISGSNTTPIRIPREMFPQSPGTKTYPVWYYGGTILTFNLTFTYVNGESMYVQHNSDTPINIYIYKEK